MQQQTYFGFSSGEAARCELIFIYNALTINTVSAGGQT